MKLISTKQPWNYKEYGVYIGEERMYVVNYRDNITEESVLACVRHTYGNKDMTIKLQP